MRSHAYGKPPKTPSLKRSAPETPARTTATKKMRQFYDLPSIVTVDVTPHHKQQRRPLFVTPPRKHSSITGLTPDRFIPNRARTDVSKARRALLSRDALWAPVAISANEERQQQQHHCETKTTTISKTADYNRQLRQTIWGTTDDVNESPLLAFGTGNNTPQRQKQQSSYGPTSIGRLESPFCQDALRSAARSQLVSGEAAMPMTTASRNNHNHISIHNLFCLSAPNMLQDRGLGVVSHGPYLAAAVGDELYLWKKKGSFDILFKGGAISCLAWSPDGRYLAVGLEHSIQVWHTEDRQLMGELFHNDDGSFITAMAWKGLEIVVANKHSIKRYDLASAHPTPIRYESHECSNNTFVTGLLWNDDYMVSCGGGSINLWGRNQQVSSPPKLTLKHDGVMTVQFHPLQPGVLVSGGDDGLKFWNVHNGALRTCILTATSVTAFVFSPFRKDECLLAHENRLSLWSLGIKATKLCETTVCHGDVLFMDCAADGKVVCVLANLVIAGFSVFRPAPRASTIGGSSLLNAVIR